MAENIPENTLGVYCTEPRRKTVMINGCYYIKLTPAQKEGFKSILEEQRSRLNIEKLAKMVFPTKTIVNPQGEE
jgi:hypothetical protein